MLSLEALQAFRSVIPPLSSSLHKGSNGRIGVIGGSLEYTGAPYFSAISALKVGADLVHVFCSQAAAPVIKGYSPELIVHPLLDVDDAVGKISPWLDRLHALVVGPGLGRDADILDTVRAVINLAPQIPIVIDADGLFMLTEAMDMFKDFKRPLILTPNAVEFRRLTEASGVVKAVYLLKGETDKIWHGGPGQLNRVIGNEPGCSRRCGGQGDVLSGIVGVFSAWAHLLDSKDIDSGTYLHAAVAASAVTRRCSHLAFQKYKRSMVASNLIEFMQVAFEQILEN